jgi:hypothetical protein
MPYEPSRGVYRYIDEQIAFKQPGAPRTAQVLPRRNYDPVEMARLARHQAREEAKQRSRAIPDNGEEAFEDDYPPRMPTVTRRYDVDSNGVPLRKQRVDHYHNSPLFSPSPGIDQPAGEPAHRRRIRPNFLVYVGIALLLLIAGWIAYAPITTAWQIHTDDVTYGNPRTFQIDEVVGHNDSNSNPSHFIAENLHGHFFVEEIPGGDISKARFYHFPDDIGNGNPPITISFRDFDNDGRMDMIVKIGDPGSQVTYMLQNDGSQFVSKL